MSGASKQDLRSIIGLVYWSGNLSGKASCLFNARTIGTASVAPEFGEHEGSLLVKKNN